MPQSQTKYLVTVVAGGQVVPGNWSLSGGKVLAEAMQDRNPLLEFPDAEGGDKTIEPVTVTSRVDVLKLTDAERTRVNGLVGVKDAITANRRPIVNGTPFGKGVTWTGTITQGVEEESDPNAENEHATVEIVFQPSGRS